MDLICTAGQRKNTNENNTMPCVDGSGVHTRTSDELSDRVAHLLPRLSFASIVRLVRSSISDTAPGACASGCLWRGIEGMGSIPGRDRIHDWILGRWRKGSWRLQ